MKDFIGASPALLLLLLFVITSTLSITGCVDNSVTPTRFFVKVLSKEKETLYTYEKVSITTGSVQIGYLVISPSSPNYLQIEKVLNESLEKKQTVCVMIQNPSRVVAIDLCKDS